nr:hypothetical protein [Candidatus Njordarchaeota archaeon]
MKDYMGRLLTLREAKRILGLTTLMIQRLDKAGKIRVVTAASGRRRIPESEVKRLLNMRGEYFGVRNSVEPF